MCNSCQSFFCGIANALDNLFTCPNSRSGNSGCGCGNNNGCGCSNGYGVANANQGGCGCNSGYGVANAVNNLFQGGCNNGNNGCGCGFDVYYAQQYALGPFSTSCNICGF